MPICLRIKYTSQEVVHTSKVWHGTQCWKHDVLLSSFRSWPSS
uniref:Uncharacterized protein n=1 Tax=Arundo donax TaxID=35708 RepID=A0A0A9N796_ARUDO